MVESLSGCARFASLSLSGRASVVRGVAIGAHRLRDGMEWKGLGCGGDAINSVSLTPGAPNELGHENAVGQVPVLSNDGFGGSEGLQVVRPFHQNAEADAPPMPPKKESGTDTTSAQGHDTTRKVSPRRIQSDTDRRTTAGARWRVQRPRPHDGGVHAGKAGDEVRCVPSSRRRFSTNSKMRLTVESSKGLVARTTRVWAPGSRSRR